MKEKFNELFPYGIDFDSAGHGTLMQNRYDELGENQIEYIENATLNFADMYKHIEEDIEILKRQSKQHVLGSHELRAINLRIETKQKLLKRARGE
jgi:hypothetical protein